jgi:polyferredoxin
LGYYPEPQKPSLIRRVVAVVTLMAIIIVTALVLLFSYVLNTTFDYNISILPSFASLPAAARGAFGSVVSYTLTTYGFIVVLVLVLAIAGTIAALFGLAGRHPEEEEF